MHLVSNAHMAAWFALVTSIASLLVSVYFAQKNISVQITGKRRAELADSLFLKFLKTKSDISYIRNPLIKNYELEEVRTRKGFERNTTIPGENYLVTLLRMKENEEEFEKLAMLPDQAKINFGDKAQSAILVLTKTLLDIAVTAQHAVEAAPTLTRFRSAQAVGTNMPAYEQLEKTMQEFEAIIWEQEAKSDSIVLALNAATAELRSALADHLFSPEKSSAKERLLYWWQTTTRRPNSK